LWLRASAQLLPPQPPVSSYCYFFSCEWWLGGKQLDISFSILFYLWGHDHINVPQGGERSSVMANQRYKKIMKKEM
jgi:hypothetical protein